MIELSALEKTFEQPGGERAIALRGVDLTMPAGQFLTVIGSNGSGKSTILNVIAGTYRPDAGTIRIAKTEVTKWPEHKRATLIGRVFQDPFKGTCPSMTVAENLRLAEMRGQRRGLRLGLSRSSRERYREQLASLACDSRGVSRRRWGRCPADSDRRSRCSWRLSGGRNCFSSTSTPPRSIRAPRSRS